MKKQILCVIALIATTTLKAQTISISEQIANLSVGAQNALSTTIYQSKKDDVINQWKSYLKNFKHEKIKMNGNELFGDNIVLKDWGNNPIDIYTIFEENKSDTSVKVIAAFNLGGAYLSSTNDIAKYALAEKMLKDFALKSTSEAINEKLKLAEKLLDKLHEGQRDLEKENKNFVTDIENYKSKISKAQDDIMTNENNQIKKKAEIEAQQSLVEQIKKELGRIN
ncbi:MAG: hypothetical protein JNK61_01435 [Bacteroidia bacterium]|nr:hypothetical protein [Bacteroidia bacterium]